MRVGARPAEEVPRLLERLDERHVHGIQPVVARTGAGLGHAAIQRMADDLLGLPHDVDQRVEIHPSGDAHVLEHVHQVFGGDHHGCPTIAAVRAAAHAADRGLQRQHVGAVQGAQRGVDRRQRHGASVVQVQVELVNGRPAALDVAQQTLDAVRHVPAHRIGDAHSLDADAGVSPRLVLHVEQVQVLFVAELSHPV